MRSLDEDITFERSLLRLLLLDDILNREMSDLLSKTSFQKFIRRFSIKSVTNSFLDDDDDAAADEDESGGG